MPATSVVICTHNPRPDYLGRVLDALRAQTLPLDQWELLFIDNASDEPVSERLAIDWHPNARYIREDELGLTAARLRGIAEARGEILVFVDDDNVLAPDYLEQVLRIADKWPILGVWGGAVEPEFEREPEPWLEPALGYLGVRRPARSIWSNNPSDWGALPIGAGLCVRMAVARAYARHAAMNPLSRTLGRTGRGLASCEDFDLAWSACDLDQGFGIFPCLRLTHLIPESRIRADYLIRLISGVTASGIVLQYLRTQTLPPRPSTLTTALRYLHTYLKKGAWQARVLLASRVGVTRGLSEIEAFEEKQRPQDRA